MSAFSNGTSWEIWSARWCDRCAVGVDACSLLDLVLIDNEVPAEWTPVGLQDYTCSEFKPTPEGTENGQH